MIPGQSHYHNMIGTHRCYLAHHSVQRSIGVNQHIIQSSTYSQHPVRNKAPPTPRWTLLGISGWDHLCTNSKVASRSKPELAPLASVWPEFLFILVDQNCIFDGGFEIEPYMVLRVIITQSSSCRWLYGLQIFTFRTEIDIFTLNFICTSFMLYSLVCQNLTCGCEIKSEKIHSGSLS